ncbi:MAG: hypothetical protein LC650_04135 [Actinobacteria bacterium]|nr:hypothetical protein [Actinomycetota bacterium]
MNFIWSTPESSWTKIRNEPIAAHRQIFRTSQETRLTARGRAFIIEPGAVAGARLVKSALTYDAANQVATFSTHLSKWVSVITFDFPDKDSRNPTEKTKQLQSYHPVFLSLLKLHKYATLGARYGFNHIAYLGDLTATSEPGQPVFDTEMTPTDGKWRGFANHFRAAFAHGNLNNDKDSPFASGAVLVAVDMVTPNTDFYDNANVSQTHPVDHVDSYHYAIEQVLKELQSAKPRRLVFHYQYRAFGAIKKESGFKYRDEFQSRLNKHLQINLGLDGDKHRGLVEVNLRALGSNIRTRPKATDDSGVSFKDFKEKAKYAMNYMNPMSYIGSKPPLPPTDKLFEAMALVDDMMMNPSASVRDIDYLSSLEKQTDELQARSAEAYLNASDLYVPPILFENAPLVPTWAVPLPASAGMESEDKDKALWTYHAQTTALVGDGRYRWTVWMPPEAIQFAFEKDNETTVSYLLKRQQMNFIVEYVPDQIWNFKNRVVLAQFVKRYLTWLYVDPERRLKKALEIALPSKSQEKKRNPVKTLLDHYFGPESTPERQSVFSLAIGHFLNIAKFQKELLAVLSDLIDKYGPDPNTSTREDDNTTYLTGIRAFNEGDTNEENQAYRETQMLGAHYSGVWTLYFWELSKELETRKNQENYRQTVAEIIKKLLGFQKRTQQI